MKQSKKPMDYDKTKMEDELKRIARYCGPKIENSKVFVSLVSKNYIDDPVCALQLGIAILLGKPLAVIAMDGAEIPETLRKIAFHVDQVENPTDAAASIYVALKKFDKEKC